MPDTPHIPDDLAELVGQVVGGLGIDARAAIRIAEGHVVPPDADPHFVEALRAGWSTADHAAEWELDQAAPAPDLTDAATSGHNRTEGS